MATTATNQAPVLAPVVGVPAANAPGDGGGQPGGGPGGNPPGGGGGGNAPPNPVQGNFSLSPAQANAANFIDYTQRTGMLLFNQATEALTVPFGVEESSLQTFVELLRDRANMCGWDEGNDPITQVNGIGLLMEYGRVTTQDLTQNVNTYIATQTRKAQNSYQMYLCITNSLTEDGRARILTNTNVFTVQDIPSGPLLLKLLVTRAAIDTRATVTHIRTSLSQETNT